MIVMLSGDSPHVRIFVPIGPTRGNPPCSKLWVGSAFLEVYSDSLTHTLAGLQQQHTEVELGVIVIASNLLYRC